MMTLVDCFQLEKHAGPYDKWPARTELIMHGELAGVTIPGYVIEAQYQHAHGYLLVTSWDCLFEEAQTFIALSSEAKFINHETVGAPYASIWLESHHRVDEQSVLFHCDNGVDILATITAGKRVKIKYVSKDKKVINFFKQIKSLLRL